VSGQDAHYRKIKFVYDIITEVIMANIKSAKKRVITSAKKAERNLTVKSAVKTAVKKVRTAVESGDKELAAKELLAATSAIDKAESKGIFKKSTASRKVSRLAQAVNKLN
jgi:small subunit ribosomal protein S20